MKTLIPTEVIELKIMLIRGQKVMLDRDLAQLYGVETRVLNQAVRRNIDRFPDDFMFSLTREEITRISQFVISSSASLETLKFSKNVMVFTEYGIAMLSSVLNSPRAIQVNIQIMRTFGKLREMIASHKDLAKRLDELEKKYDGQFRVVFDAIHELMIPADEDKRKIGFEVRESQAVYKTRHLGNGRRVFGINTVGQRLWSEVQGVCRVEGWVRRGLFVAKLILPRNDRIGFLWEKP